MNDETKEYTDLINRMGGMLDRSQLNEDSALGSSWTLGEHKVAISTHRIKAPEGRTPENLKIRTIILQKPLLNAVVSRMSDGFSIALFWPLILTLQGVAAAIWANPKTAPWVGNIDRLPTGSLFNSEHPHGFDLYLAEQNLIEFEPSHYRSGVRADHIDSIISAGDDRWESFLATWKASVDYVWNHELAHILYGHVDFSYSMFNSKMLYESEGEARAETPDALSQFIEYIADMDASMQLFASFYGSMFDKDAVADQDIINVGAATALGVLLAMYVLHQGAVIQGKEHIASKTHPPLRHRAAWVLGAESQAISTLQSQNNYQLTQARKHNVATIREATQQLLHSVAQTHTSLHSWISQIDSEAEAKMNEYINGIHTASSKYFDGLSKYQLV